MQETTQVVMSMEIQELSVSPGTEEFNQEYAYQKL